MFKKKRVHPNIILDWFSITYRSIALIVISILLISVAIVLIYYYFREGSPKAEARHEINRAEQLYSRASSLAVDEKLQELKDGSRKNLDNAVTEFERKNYTDSKISAIRSQNLSQKIIDISTGQGSTGAGVRFYKIEGDVKVRKAGSFVWEGASPNQTLGFGDQIKTSSTSSAQVIYFDGTMTTISPGSLLEIREVSEDPRTKVQKVHEKLTWGALQASTQKRKTEGSFHEVSTETTRATSDQEAEFKVSHDKESGESSVDLYSGSLQVASRAEKVILNTRERVRVAKEGTISEKEVIPVAPKLVSPPEQKIFVYTNPADASTALVWEKVPKSVGYHLVISNLPLFSNPILDRRDIKSNYVEIPALPEGNYYWKVAAVYEHGIEGIFSEVRKYRITSSQLRDRSDTVPPKVEIKDPAQIGPLVIINGKTEPGAMLWVDSERVDVYDDGTFYAVVRLRKEGVNEINIVAQDSSGNETVIRKKAFLEAF